MSEAEFMQFIQEKGYVTIPCWLLEKHQSMDISPEELGYLLLALYHVGKVKERAGKAAGEMPFAEKPLYGENPWLAWALEKSWAVWQGEGDKRQAVFTPLWQAIFAKWKEEQEESEREKLPRNGMDIDFDYSRIVKELDRMRGSLSVTIREEQLIQEFNLKYGWSTDFILNFFRLCGKRNLTQVKNYRPLAMQIHRSGIYTLEGLTAFMNDVDWINKLAYEIKKDYLGLNRTVTVPERDLYVKWHVTWGFSHLLIVRAAEVSVGAAHPTFKYIDTIMAHWYERGVKTLEDSEAAIQLFKEEQEKKKRKNPARQTGARAERRKADVEQGANPWAGFTFDGEGNRQGSAQDNRQGSALGSTFSGKEDENAEGDGAAAGKDADSDD